MKRTTIIIILLLIAGIATASKAVQPYDYYGDCSQYNKQVYCLTNRARENNGLKPLKYSLELEKVSKDKSEDMCNRNYFAHDYLDRKWTYFLDINNVYYQKAGENLAKGYQTASEAVDGLLASKSHYHNIMGDYTHTGVYTASCGGVNYTTQTFAKL